MLHTCFEGVHGQTHLEPRVREPEMKMRLNKGIYEYEFIFQKAKLFQKAKFMRKNLNDVLINTAFFCAAQG